MTTDILLKLFCSYAKAYDDFLDYTIEGTLGKQLKVSHKTLPTVLITYKDNNIILHVKSVDKGCIELKIPSLWTLNPVRFSRILYLQGWVGTITHCMAWVEESNINKHK